MTHVTGEPSDEAAGPPVWFAHVAGGQLGPLSRGELAAMAADGRLRPDDLVWESGTPDWVPAAQVLPFAPPPAAFPPSPPLPRRASSEKRAPLLARVASDFGSVELSELLPLRRAAEPEVLGVPSTWLLLLFALAPLLVGAVVEDPTLKVRLFRLGAGAAWAVFLLSAFGGARLSSLSSRLRVALFCGGGLLAALLVSLLPSVPPVSWLLTLTEPARAWPVRLLGFLLSAGLVEEGAKLLLLVLLARALGGLAGPFEGVFAGLVLGAGFGLWEAMVASEWTSSRDEGFFAMLREPTAGLEALFVSSLARALAIPALEAAWGASAGYFAGLAAARRAPSLLLAGLLLAALLHGAYATLGATDQGLAALLVAALSLLSFLAFRREAARLTG